MVCFHHHCECSHRVKCARIPKYAQIEKKIIKSTQSLKLPTNSHNLSYSEKKEHWKKTQELIYRRPRGAIDAAELKSLGYVVRSPWVSFPMANPYHTLSDLNRGLPWIITKKPQNNEKPKCISGSFQLSISII